MLQLHILVAVIVCALVIALVWLRPERALLVRGITAVVCFEALLAIMHFQTANPHVGYWSEQLIYRGDIALLLLGRYLLKQPWSCSILALGVYRLIACIQTVIFSIWQFSEMQLMVSFVLYSSMLWGGLLVWLFSRKYGHGYFRCVLLAAAVAQFLSIYGAFAQSPFTDVFDILPMQSDWAFYFMAYGSLVVAELLASALYILFLRYLFGLSFKRALACAFVLECPLLLQSMLLSIS